MSSHRTSFLQNIGDEHSLNGGDLETDYLADSHQKNKRVKLSCSVIVVIIFSLLIMGSGFATLSGGVLLAQSLRNVGFSCAILNILGYSTISFSAVVLLVAALLLIVAFRCEWFKAASRAARNPEASKIKLVCKFGFCYVAQFVILAALILFAIIAFVAYGMSKNFPDLHGDHSSVKGIDGPIKIVRDANGLAHIDASSKLDAVFGQGFVHGQDRLWEVEFQRLAAKGQLAAHVGEAGLKFDKQTRTLNFVGAATMLCDSMSAEQNRYIQAYVDGLNYFLATSSARPPEFLLMSTRLFFYHEPEPYKPIDVCLAMKLLQWRLSFNINKEIERFKVFWETGRSYDEILSLYVNQTNITGTILNAEQMDISEADAVRAREREAEDHDIERELYDTYMTDLRNKFNPDAAKKMKDKVKGAAIEEKDAEDAASTSDFARFLKHMDITALIHEKASNAWAARGEGHATPCGASDPHLTINMPSVWYYAHLHWGDFDTAGVGMLGIPGVHIGKTTHVSWGITMSLTDLGDLYILVPDVENEATHYMHNGDSVPYTYREETIDVRWSDSYSLKVRESVYGPVATEALGLPKELDVAVWAQPLQRDPTSMASMYNFMNENITTVTEFRDKVFGNMRSPGFSIPLGDVHGNIGYCITGAHIVRSKGHTGIIPTLGNGSFDRMDEIPYEKLPTMIRNAPSEANVSMWPSEHVSCANQKMYPDGYNYTLGYDYAYPWRGRRLQQMLEETDPTNLSNVSRHVEIQSDVRSNIWAFNWMPILVDDGNGTVTEKFTKLLDPADGMDWWKELTQKWDHRCPIGSIHPTFMWFWARSLASTCTDAMKAVDKPVWMYGYELKVFANATDLMNTDCAAKLPKDASEGYPKNCIGYAAYSWNKLAKQYPLTGRTSSIPKWGKDVNRLWAKHLMLHGTPFACMFERESNKDGDHTSVDVADTTLGGDIGVFAASSMRQIYDWSRPNTIHFAFPGGESGNPYSTRYDNLLKRWSEDIYTFVDVINGTKNVTSTFSAQTLSP